MRRTESLHHSPRNYDDQLAYLALLCLLVGCSGTAPRQSSGRIPGHPGGSIDCQAATYVTVRSIRGTPAPRMTGVVVSWMPNGHEDRTRRLGLLGLAAFASMASMRWCNGVMLPVLASEFSATAGQTGGVVYAFAIAYGVMHRWFTAHSATGSASTRWCPLRRWPARWRRWLRRWRWSLGWFDDGARTDRGHARLGPLARHGLDRGSGALGATAAGPGAFAQGQRHRDDRLAQWLAGVFADALGWRAGFVAVAILFATRAWRCAVGRPRRRAYGRASRCL